MIKFISSGMAGAPSLSGTAGAMISVLDACLVNGFGSATVDSVVISGGVATVTRASGHPFEDGSIALIAGATVTGGSINGDQCVLSYTSNTYTFDATGIADQTATGTISHKVSPLGFAKTYSGTNLAAYKSGNAAATACLLRVDDTGTTSARVVGYLTMSDVNTGAGPFPTDAQVSGGAYWPKSTNGTVRPWILCGDDRGFVLFVIYSNVTGPAMGIATTSASVYFGDFNSLKSPDPYACLLAGTPSDPTPVNAPADLSYALAVATSTAFLNQWHARGVSGVGSSVAGSRQAQMPAGAASGSVSGASGLLAYPNVADNGLHLSPFNICEINPTYVWRGVLPGLYYVPHSVGSTVFAQKELIDSITGLSGRKLRAICNGTGVMFVDITGPWR